MRRFTAILFFLALSVSALTGQTRPPSTMRFDRDEIDLGRIREADGPVTLTFEFTNTGTEPFVIENILVSCGCTTPEYSKAPILSGRKGSINITFDPSGYSGTVSRDIHVVSNERRNTNRLTIKAEVVRRARTIAEDYPFVVASGLRLDANYVNFVYIDQGKVHSQSIKYTNNSAHGILLSATLRDPNPLLSISAPHSVCAGCSGEITLTYDLSRGNGWGMFNDEVLIRVNGEGPSYTVMVTAIGTDNFDNVNRNSAPRGVLMPSFINFGMVRAGAAQEGTITITNEGAGPLIIRSVGYSGGASSSLKEGDSIAAGGSMRVSARLATTAGERRFQGSIIIIFNDPDRPMRDIRLIATAD
jgi:hypothetical protein